MPNKKPIAKIPTFILSHGFAVIMASYLALLAANFVLCRDQTSCPVRVGWIDTYSFKYIFNRLIPITVNFYFWLYLSWALAAALFTILLLILHYASKKNSGARAKEPSSLIKALNTILAILYAPLWAGLLSLTTLGFLADRKVFLILLLLFFAAGFTQNICEKYLKKLLWRALSASMLTGAVFLLTYKIVFPSMHTMGPLHRAPHSIVAGDIFYIACIIFMFLIIGSGFGPADLMKKTPPGADWFFRRFKTASFFLIITILNIPQFMNPRPPECSGIAAADKSVRIVLGKYRAFTVATSYDAKYLYYGSDYGDRVYRIALKENRKPDSLFIGKYVGTMRFHEDRDSALLYIPVIVFGEGGRLVIVDEKTFKIKKIVSTPPFIGNQVMDMALEKTAGEALFLGRFARVLFYKFGANRFGRVADISSAFPNQELHRVMRIEVNEKRRVAYICPYPNFSSPRIIAEFNLDTLKVNRTREFDSHPNVVRVIDGGRRLLVGLDMSQNILMLDADTLKVIKTYPAGFTTRDIAVDEDAGIMAIGNFITGTVNLIRLSDGRLLKTWQVGRGVRSVHIDARNSAVYAASLCGAVEMKLP